MRKRILIIEDDFVVAMVYRRFLSAHNFDTEVVADGIRGLKSIEIATPDAVLLDLMLPKAHGLEILKAIRAEPRWQHLPVLVLTGAAVPEFVKQAQEAGANRVFDKANDKPVAIVNFLHDLLHTTSDNRLVAPTANGNSEALLEQWPKAAEITTP